MANTTDVWISGRSPKCGCPRRRPSSRGRAPRQDRRRLGLSGGDAREVVGEGTGPIDGLLRVPAEEVDARRRGNAPSFPSTDRADGWRCFGWRATAPWFSGGSGMARLRPARSGAYSLVAGRTLSGGEVEGHDGNDGRRRRACKGDDDRDQDLGKGRTHRRTLTQRTRPPRYALLAAGSEEDERSRRLRIGSRSKVFAYGESRVHGRGKEQT
jgi:hypothetical protein